MMPIDEFINQLIQSGLADSFLDVIQLHYMKVIEVYDIISFIDKDNVIDIDCVDSGNEIDSLKVVLTLKEPVEIEDSRSQTSEFTIQIINNSNVLEITVTNNYESEDVIYENRFNGRRTPYTHKWS